MASSKDLLSVVKYKLIMPLTPEDIEAGHKMAERLRKKLQVDGLSPSITPQTIEAHGKGRNSPAATTGTDTPPAITGEGPDVEDISTG